MPGSHPTAGTCTSRRGVPAGGLQASGAFPWTAAMRSRSTTGGVFVAWEVLAHGICYINLQADPSAIELLHLATGEVSQVMTLEKTASVWPGSWGFTVSPDERWVVYQVLVIEKDIMLVENFR